MSQRRFHRKHLKDLQGVLPDITPIKVDYDGWRSGNCPEEALFTKVQKIPYPKLNCSMISKYESSVERINWAANNSRPDLALAASSLASRAPKMVVRDSSTASGTSAKASSRSWATTGEKDSTEESIRLLCQRH